MNGRSAAISHFKEGKYLNSHSSVTELIVMKYHNFFFIGECAVGVTGTLELQNMSLTEMHSTGLDIW